MGNLVRSRLTCGGCRGLGDGSLVGKNICPSSRVFGLCPGSDKGPQGGIGSKGPMVAVLVNAWRRKDGGEAVEELEGREAERRATGRVG